MTDFEQFRRRGPPKAVGRAQEERSQLGEAPFRLIRRGPPRRVPEHFGSRTSLAGRRDSQVQTVGGRCPVAPDASTEPRSSKECPAAGGGPTDAWAAGKLEILRAFGLGPPSGWVPRSLRSAPRASAVTAAAALDRAAVRLEIRRAFGLGPRSSSARLLVAVSE